jgi:AraC-like DNA-binding protein
MNRWLRRRTAWTGQIQHADFFLKLFEQLPGVHFFAKDRDGVLMYASRGLMERYGMRDESEFLGRTDYDINPGCMAEAYVADDRRILSGEVESIERIELWWDRQGMPDWFMVSKRVVLDRDGRIHGVAGVLRRPADSERALPAFQGVAKAVELIRSQFAVGVRITDVARQCGRSLRQLQRQFQAAFGLSPQDFLTRTRVLAAMRFLDETVLSAAEIAERCGFTDPSAFGAHFLRWAGKTPIEYRRRTNTGHRRNG